MALEHIDHAGTPTRAGIIFPMRDRGETMAIVVTDEALRISNRRLRSITKRTASPSIESVSRKWRAGNTPGGDRVTLSTNDI
jgi:hypothetical protein